MQGRYRGWTLIELIVVVAVLTLIVTLAVPAMQGLMARTGQASAVNLLVATLHQARSEAAARSRQTVVCKSPDGKTCRQGAAWDQGWMLFVDPNENTECPNADGDRLCDDDNGRILAVQDDSGALAHVDIRATGKPKQKVAFDPVGYADGYAGTYLFCLSSGQEREVVISMTGRIRLSKASVKSDC